MSSSARTRTSTAPAVGDGCFLATGSSLFPGSRLGAGVEVRINGVVHVNTALDDGAMVPIGWVAVGDPARVLPPAEHDAIWEVQEGLDFPGTVYGLPRDAPPRERMERQTAWFGAHRDDRELPDPLGPGRPSRRARGGPPGST